MYQSKNMMEWKKQWYERAEGSKTLEGGEEVSKNMYNDNYGIGNYEVKDGPNFSDRQGSDDIFIIKINHK